MSEEIKRVVEEWEEKAALSYALKIQSEFHLPEPIHFVGDIEAGHIEKLSKSAIAWYEPETDAIFVNTTKMKNHCQLTGDDMQDTMGETLFHEAVGHYGLRLLLGEKFEATMRHIYDHADGSLRMKLLQKRGQLEELQDAQGKYIHRQTPEPVMRVLTVEELMSDMAQHMDSHRPKHRSLLSRFAKRLGEALKAMCFPYCQVTEKDLKRMLERSYHKVKSRSWAGQAVDSIVKRHPRLTFLESSFAKHTLQSYNIRHGLAPDTPKPSTLLGKAAKLFFFVTAPYIMVPIYVVQKVKKVASTQHNSANSRFGEHSRMPISREILNQSPLVLQEAAVSPFKDIDRQLQHQQEKRKDRSNERSL